MARIEGNTPFAFACGFAMVHLASTQRDDHGAATSTELRVLRQGSAAECDGRADLFIGMYVLRGLRREQAAQCVRELRRRLRAAADPPGHRMAARTIDRKAATVGQARASFVQS